MNPQSYLTWRRALAVLCLFAAICPSALADYASEKRVCATDAHQLSPIRQYQLSRASWRYQLKATLYDFYAPPNYPDDTNVSILVWAFGLSRVDEVNQAIKINTYVELKWRDERLAFDLTVNNSGCTFPFRGKFTLQPADVISGPQQDDDSTIWVPRIILDGRLDGVTTPFLKPTRLTVDTENGEVYLRALFHEALPCRLQTRRFPFDKQFCSIRFQNSQNVLLVHDKAESEKFAQRGILAAEIGRSKNALSYETNEWRMYANEENFVTTLTKPTVMDDGETIEYSVDFNRKYAQHVINWIVSPIVLSVSCVVGMYHGCDVGERFGFGGTIVVTITLMVNELRSVLGVGEDYPILGRMYLGLELTLILATLASGLPEQFHGMLKVANEKQIGVVDVGWRAKAEAKCLGVMQGWSDDYFDLLVSLFIMALQVGVVSYCVVMWLI